MFALLLVSLYVPFVSAGAIVPSLDDATALFDETAASPSDATADITPIEGAGQITLAASFTPVADDIANSFTGPVFILEVGGTSYGHGVYIVNGNLVFASKGANGSSGNYAYPAGMHDLDASDSAAVATIGRLTADVQTDLYVSFDANTGQINAVINDVDYAYLFTGTVGSANLTGNESVTFLGDGGAVNAGNCGGLERGEGMLIPQLNSDNAYSMIGSGEPVRGQIFAAYVPGELPPYAILAAESNGTTQVAEGGTTDTLAISITANPANDPVTITITDTQAPDQVQAVPAQVIFDSGNWQTAQTVTISAVDDDLRKPRQHTTTLSLDVQTDPASGYYGYILDDVAVQITENDCEVWGYSAFDVNQDCQIDMADMLDFVQAWLECSLPQAGCVDYRP